MPETAKEQVKSLIKEKHPSSVFEIKTLLRERGAKLEDDELLKALGELESEGLLKLKAHSAPSSFVAYLADYRSSWWIYLILMVASSQAFLVFFGPDSPVVGFFRAVLGLGILGFIPGYSSQRALFPGRELTFLERALLSIFLSIVISTSLGLLLGFVFLFRPEPNAALLNLYTFIVTLFAGYRSFLAEQKQGPIPSGSSLLLTSRSALHADFEHRLLSCVARVYHLM